MGNLLCPNCETGALVRVDLAPQDLKDKIQPLNPPSDYIIDERGEDVELSLDHPECPGLHVVFCLNCGLSVDISFDKPGEVLKRGQ